MNRHAEQNLTMEFQNVQTPSERWQQVVGLLESALDVPPEQRAAFLDRVCLDDPALRRKVVTLLKAHDRADDFLEGLDVERATALLRDAGAPEARQVGPYRLMRRLGRGGMGVVYLARDPRLNRLVALKLLPPHLSADDTAKRRLIKEARAASALDHANIATIYEIDETEHAQLFIAMAYYEGRTLREKIEQGPLPVEEAVGLVRQLAEGLAAAHEKGIVHRDIKPSNILVTDKDIAKIVDFGIAKVAGAALTKTGTTMGTVAYMSPEQTRGETVDHRTDLWALGVTLYEMLTGVRPFRGDHDQTVIYAIRHDEPAPVADLRSEAPAALADIVGRCLEKDPSARYQHAGEVLADLAAFEAGSAGIEAWAGGRLWRQRAARYGSLAGLFAVLLVGVLLLWPRLLSRDAATENGAEAGMLDHNRLAVLPLDNISPDSTDAYFADGMTEELIARLSKLSALRVIARTSVMRYKGTRQRIADIGRELAVETILEGSVRKVNDQVRVSVQLVDARSEEQLWSQDYDAEVADVLAVQSQIAQRVAQALDVQMKAGDQRQLEKRGTDDPEAYTLYLKGRYFWNKWDGASVEKARAHFQQALDLDPAYAQAWTGLSDAYEILGALSVLSPEEAFPRARAAAERALAIDGELAEAHVSLATVLEDYYWDWAGAERHLRQAVGLDPNYAAAHQVYAEHLRDLGRFDDALAEAKKAQELDPLSTPVQLVIGTTLYMARRYEEAIVQFQRLLERDPGFTIAYFNLGLAYTQQGKYEEAISTLQKVDARGGYIPNTKALLGYSYAASGRRAEARQILDALDELSKEQYVSAFHKAAIHTGLGEKDQALELLEQAYEERVWMMRLLKVEPMFDPLRSDPRFTELLKKVGLAEG